LTTASARTQWRLQVALLGLLTIGSFGVVLYGFGALVSPIEDDTGWSNAAISAAFSISSIAGGALAIVTGRLLDRVGAQPVMGATLVVGSALLWLSSYAESSWKFVATWSLGGAIISAGLLYNLTMAVTTRITPVVDRPAAFTWLTLIGGLSSPIAFPLAGAFVEAWGWRGAVRGLVVFMIVCCVPAIIWVRGDRGRVEHHVDAELPGFADIRSAVRAPLVRRWLYASSLGMAGLVAVQVHHVGAIEATGVTIGVASALGGIRGFLSLPGRAAAATLTHRVGIVNSLRLVYGVMALGTLALVAAGAIAWVWVFVVLTGLAFGSVAPLQGLYAAELYGQRRIGSLMGMQQLIVGSAGALGPFVLGLTIDATGGYDAFLIGAATLQVLALVAFRDPTRASERASAPVATP
jgi:MFS family permease